MKLAAETRSAREDHAEAVQQGVRLEKHHTRGLMAERRRPFGLRPLFHEMTCVFARLGIVHAHLRVRVFFMRPPV